MKMKAAIDDGASPNNSDGLVVTDSSAAPKVSSSVCGNDNMKNDSSITSQQQHINTLQQLDTEYTKLCTTEQAIQKYLQQLQNEETKLRLALEQSSTSIKEQREKESKRKDEEAVARLEEALMMSDGDDSSEDNNDEVSV